MRSSEDIRTAEDEPDERFCPECGRRLPVYDDGDREYYADCESPDCEPLPEDDDDLDELFM